MTDTNAAATESAPSVAPEAGLQSTERPAWLPEGFADGAALAKSYEALRTKMSQGGHKSDPAPEPTSTEPAPQSTEAEPGRSEASAVNLQDAQSAVKAAGLSYEELQAEYARNGGQLSDSAYAALEAAGIDRRTVDAHTRGQEAVAREIRSQVFNTVGGEEAYGDLIMWAKDNLSPSEQAAFNRSANSGDLDTIKLAVAGLQSRYTADVGVTPKLIGGGSGHGSQSHGDAFSSTSELTAAMKDPRYQHDESYRQSVRDRLARSNVI
ncbi:capsid assembly protein [Bradyrhizobium embrapense]